MSGDDIVVGNVKYFRVDGTWAMTPNGKSGMFHIDPRRRELLDEIVRLRAETAEWKHRVMGSTPINVTITRNTEIELLRSEIVRLRAAGDALAEAVCSWHGERIPVEFLDPLTAWEEARREQ